MDRADLADVRRNWNEMRTTRRLLAIARHTASSNKLVECQNLPQNLENAYGLAVKRYDGSSPNVEMKLDTPVPSACEDIVKSFAEKKGFGTTLYSYPKCRSTITFGVKTPRCEVGKDDYAKRDRY